jgi:hypothetical protein
MRTIILILRRTATVWILMVLTALPVLAAVEDDIARDFGPLAGYVVMEENSEFIIDLDAGHGIRLGDIFAVVGPGKEIVHPVTQKVLGKLETVKGILKVTRMGSGYSFARALDESPDVTRGDAIRRYALLPAIFWDYSGSGKPIYSKLREMLPQLKWREYHKTQQQRPTQSKPTAATANALTFIYAQDELVVRDPEFNEHKNGTESTGCGGACGPSPAIDCHGTGFHTGIQTGAKHRRIAKYVLDGRLSFYG